MTQAIHGLTLQEICADSNAALKSMNAHGQGSN